MLTNKTIILGITGGIAAYKAADMASKLVQEGAEVRVVMTESATEFISPLTFRSLTGRPVVTEMFELASEFSIEHVALAEAADVVVIAPATANSIAKLAAGIADDMLTCTVLATTAPVIVAPAMDVNMFQNSITQENLAKLKARGFIIVDPGHGRLASGKTGQGRLAEIEKIIGTIKQVLGRSGDLAGKSVVVTAGGTQEAIDPVRYVGNRSSGKMGYAVAEAARDRGAKVTLITAPTALTDPVGMEITRVESVSQMKEVVVKACAQTDALIMAAAPADYQPKTTASQKIKKGAAGLTLELVKAPDILSEVKGDFVKVGFSAETEDLIENARQKLEKKQLDLIAANDVTAADSGFGVDTNKVTLISRDGKIEDLPLMTKREVADRILDRVVGLLPSIGKRLLLEQEAFTITLTSKRKIEDHLIKIPPDVRYLFPEKGKSFILDVVGVGEIVTRVRRTTEDGGTWMWQNLGNLFSAYPKLRVGNSLHFIVIESKHKYHVDIVN